MAVTNKQKIESWLNLKTEQEIKELTNQQIYDAFPKISKSTIRDTKMKWLSRRVEHVEKRSPHDQHTTIQSRNATLGSNISARTSRKSTIAPPDPPVSTPGGSPLPKSLQNIVSLAPHFKNIPSWMGPYIIERLKEQEQEYIPNWTRPPLHHPIQHEAIDEILYGNKTVIMIDGSKRRGKSTTVFSAFCEAQYNNRGLKRWFLYGATEDNARKILRGISEDPLFYKYTSPLFPAKGSAMKITAYNQGRMEVMASGSERATSGTDADVIWIDESHSVLIENPKTIAMAAMVLLAQKNMKIIFTMNREGQAYEYFKNEMLNTFPPEDIAYFSFVEANCPHIAIEQDQKVRAIVNASAGPDYAAQYLDNQYVRENGLYYPLVKIQEAYGNYDTPRMEQYDMIGCGIDWGDEHDCAFLIGGFLNNEFYEEETIYLQHPVEHELMRVFTRVIRDFPGVVFIWENSPLGTFARNAIRKAFPNQRFIDSGFSKYKQNYLDNLYIWLSDGDMHLKDPKLKRQLISYCGDKKNDDGHDALAHLLYKGQKPRTQMKQQMTVISRQ